MKSRSNDEWNEYLINLALNNPDHLPYALWQMANRRILVLLVTQMCQLLSTALNQSDGENNGTH
jgi:hypothetical protein